MVSGFVFKIRLFNLWFEYSGVRYEVDEVEEEFRVINPHILQIKGDICLNPHLMETVTTFC